MALTQYGGVYRSVCLEVLVDRVRVQIPQLFASETVTIFECAGPRPVSGDEGWVAFESGLAERPIWMGSESKGLSGGDAIAVWPPYQVFTSAVAVDNAAGGNTDVAVLDGTYAAAFDGWIEILVGGGYAGLSSSSVNVRQGVYSPSYLDPTGQPWFAFGYMASPPASTWELVGDCVLSIPVTKGDTPTAYWRGNWSPSALACSFRSNVTVKFYAEAGQADIIGLVGPSGPAGPPGPPGGTYEFLLAPGPSGLARAAPVTPAPGEVLLNSTDQTLVTMLWVSTQTVHGVDITDVLRAHNVGHVWYLYDKANPSIRMEYEVVGTPTDYGTYFEYAVTLKQYLGPIPLGPIYGAGITTDTGGGDGGGGSYRFVQTTAATVWVINHGLPFYPNVTVVDSSGREVVPGAVDYAGSTVTLTFSAAFGGEAYLS